MKKQAWIGVYRHEYGVDVDLYWSEQDAYHTLAQVAFENRDDLEKGDLGEENVEVLTQMVEAYKAGDYKKVVELFNGNLGVSGHMFVHQPNMANAAKHPEPLTVEQLEGFLPEADEEWEDDDE